MAALNGLLGNRSERDRWSKRALQCDPLSTFIRGIVGMACYFSGDFADALAHYDAGLALDSNSVLCLWQSAVTLDRLGRFEDALARIRRAVELSRRGVLMVSFEYRALMRLGRTDEAQALGTEVRARSTSEYVADTYWLNEALFRNDEDAIEAALRMNMASGGTTLGISVDRELADLLPHPRLGPLVRQLTLFKNGLAVVGSPLQFGAQPA